MSHPELVPLVVVTLVTLVAATTDLLKFKVYNILTLPTLLCGLVASYGFGGLHGLGVGLLGAGLGFGVLVVFYVLGGVGAGDVKLFAAIGVWLGPALTAQVFVASALAAGVYAMGLLVLRSGVTGAAIEVSMLGQMALSPRNWGQPATRIEIEAKRSDRRRRLVPFAAMTFLGFLATLAWSSINLDKVETHFGQPTPISIASVSQTGGVR